MKYYNDTLSAGESFAERIGPPEEFDAALGKITAGFSFLERSLSNVIILMLGVSSDVGEIATAELSTKNKINLFSSLFKHDLHSYKKVDQDIEARFEELLSLCNKAIEHRNRIVHSDYILYRYRVKTTAKSKTGLQRQVEPISPDYLLDISDFITSVGMHLEVFPFGLGLADRASGRDEIAAYYKDGRLIMKIDYLEEQSATQSNLTYDFCLRTSATGIDKNILDSRQALGQTQLSICSDCLNCGRGAERIKNYYNILGVPKGVDIEEMRTAFRALAMA